MKTFQQIASGVKGCIPSPSGVLCPSREDCRKLFSPAEREWLRACRNWLKEGNTQPPDEIYADIGRIGDCREGLGFRKDVARLFLLCTEMAAYAQRLCKADEENREEIVHRLFGAARKALTGEESTAESPAPKATSLGQLWTADSPESIVRTVLESVAEKFSPARREDFAGTWHLRRVGWLYDVTSLLLGEQRIGVKTRVPFVLVPESDSQENTTSASAEPILAEFGLEVLPDGSGQIFVASEQAFVGFEKGFDDIFDPARIEKLWPQDGEKDVDIRVRINRLDAIEGTQPLLDRDILKGRSATAAAALGFYCALNKKVYDSRVIVLAEADIHGCLAHVEHIPVKINRALTSGRCDTIVVAKQDEEQARRALAGIREVKLLTVEYVADLKDIRSVLTENALKYLNQLARHCAELPPYYPRHLQQTESGETAFDQLRQKVKVVEDRRELDRWLSLAKERQRAAGLDPDMLTYGPHRGMPEQDGEEERRKQVETVLWDDRARRRFKRAVILGDPGFGKSWLLRYEARRLARKAIHGLEQATVSVEDIELPILVRLSDLNRLEGPLEDALVELTGRMGTTTENPSIGRVQRSDTFCRFVRERLKTIRCHLLLDAWDEVPERQALQTRIKEFARDFAHPHILLTSRIVGYDVACSPLPKAEELELPPFDGRQIESFVQVWFGENSETARSFLVKLKQHHQICGLARIPLMLSLICKTCPDGQFPSRRGQLYDACLRGLLLDWIRKEDVSTSEYELARKIRDNSEMLEGILDLLGYVSLKLFRKNCEQFKTADLRPIIGEFLEALKDWHELNPRNTPFDLSELIAVLKAQGIFVAANSGDDSPLLFLHRTFAEYLAAFELAKKEGAIETALEYLYDPAWHEVLVVLGGCLDSERARVYVAALLRRNEEDLFCRPFFLAVDVSIEIGSDRLSEKVFARLAEATVKTALGRVWLLLADEAACRVGHFPEMAIEPLTVALEDENTAVREAATQALIYLASTQTTEPLRIALKDGHWPVRRNAAVALGKIGSNKAVGILIDALSDQNPYIRRAAVIGLTGARSHQSVEPLIQTLREKREDAADFVALQIRYHAANALAAIGSEQAIKGILETMKDDIVFAWDIYDVLSSSSMDADKVAALLEDAIQDSNFDRICDPRFAEPLTDLASERTVRFLIEAFERMDINIGSECVNMRFIVKVLGKIGSTEAVEYLLRLLSEREACVCQMAAEALIETEADLAVAPLVDTLSWQYEDIREEDARLFERDGAHLREADCGSRENYEAKRDRRLNTRPSAVDALVEIGSEEAVRALLDALKHKRWFVRRDAAEALGRIGSWKAVNPLIAALSDENWVVRVGAAEALGELDSRQAVEPLVDAQSDEIWQVRDAATEALAAIGGSQVFGQLVGMLKDEDWHVRDSAVRGLGDLGAKGAMKSICGTLRDADLNVRRSAAIALRQIGSQEAVEDLITALTEENEDVRASIIKSLGVLGSEYGVGPLLQILTNADSSTFIRSVAADALGQIGSHQAAAPLLQALQDENWEVRYSAATALGQLRSSRALQPLLEASNRDLALYRKAALRAICQLDAEEVTEPLVAALSNEHRLIRISAVEALGEIASPRAVEGLTAALKDEDRGVRSSAAHALGELDSVDAVQRLAITLWDDESNIRQYAREALVRRLDLAGTSLSRDVVDSSYLVMLEEFQRDLNRLAELCERDDIVI